MGLAGRLPAASPGLSCLRWPRRVAAGGDYGGVSPRPAGPHGGDSEAATKVVPSFSHAGPGQLYGDAEERVYWDLSLAGPDLYLAQGWRDLTWPPRSRSHALG